MADYGLVVLAAAFLLVLAFLYLRPQSRAERAWSETALLRYSNLHLFTTTLNEIRDLDAMVEQTLTRTLQSLTSECGCLLVQTPQPENRFAGSIKGFSSAAIERLTSEPLRDYVANSVTRWGREMVFTDQREAGAVAGFRGDPTFPEFQRLMLSEGLRSLVVMGLRSNERTFGALLVGSRSLRTFQPGELRLLLAISHQISVDLENRYLHDASERHHEEMTALHHIGEALSTSCDPAGQLLILRSELASSCGPVILTLTNQDQSTGELETISTSDERYGDLQLEDRGLVEYVLNNRAPLWIAYNVQGNSRRLGIASVDRRLRTWCGIPLRYSDASTGVLSVVDLEREYAVREEQFRFLQVLAGEITVAIENARIFQKEQQRSRHLVILNDLGRKAAAMMNPQELLTSLCPQIRTAFGYNHVRIETFDRRMGDLVVEAAAGYPNELRGRRTRLGSGLAGIAAEQGEAVVSNFVQRDARYVAIDSRVLSAASFPLKFADKVLAVLSFENHRTNSFGQQDILTLRVLAEQLAVALHNTRAYQTAQEQAITDGLTGLKTHRYFREALEAEWRRAPRSGKPFSVIMLDLDRFKPVNDERGHLEGDRVLRTVARVLESRSRQSSVAARYGGDEFAILMPDASVEQAELLAERLRASFTSDGELSKYGLTASFGIATFPLHGATPDEILRVADSGMYLAKHEQGNRVRLASLVEPDEHIQAYLGVAVKRMISTGPEVFEHYLRRFEQAARGASEEGVSLLDTVTALAFVIEAKDRYTRGHSQSVARLAAGIARRVGLQESDVEEIRLAGILHDIGKIGIPEHVLNKPGRLTPDEYEVMKAHAALGSKILGPLKAKSIERICAMVRHHHERVDGKGYPDRLKGDAIPLGARILSVADAYDTIVSERAYQAARSIEDAMRELERGRGVHFDPALVDAFADSREALIDPATRAPFEEAVS